MPNYLVFDVESVGLHGEGYAVGWTLINEYGDEIEIGLEACSPLVACGDPDGLQWIAANAPNLLVTCESPEDVRNRFWQSWLEAKAQGAILVADCPWPVEAVFLAQAVDDAPRERAWQGPYPLIDVASVRFAAGLDPLGTEERLPNELPLHDPLADARQSARLLIEALKVCKEK